MAKRKRFTVPNVTFEITLPADLHGELMEAAAAGGIAIGEYIRVALRGVRKSPLKYGLNTRLLFGKYKGETVEDVMRTDIGYIVWAHEKVERFVLAEDALELLIMLGGLHPDILDPHGAEANEFNNT